MTVDEAESQLDRLEKNRGVVLSNRTRHMILRAVAAGVSTIAFRGLDADLTTKPGIAVAAGLLHFHPTAWIETIPEVFASPMATETLTEKPSFGL